MYIVNPMPTTERENTQLYNRWPEKAEIKEKEQKGHYKANSKMADLNILIATIIFNKNVLNSSNRRLIL